MAACGPEALEQPAESPPARLRAPDIIPCLQLARDAKPNRVSPAPFARPSVRPSAPMIDLFVSLSLASERIAA